MATRKPTKNFLGLRPMMSYGDVAKHLYRIGMSDHVLSREMIRKIEVSAMKKLSKDPILQKIAMEMYGINHCQISNRFDNDVATSRKSRLGIAERKRREGCIRGCGKTSSGIPSDIGDQNRTGFQNCINILLASR